MKSRPTKQTIRPKARPKLFSTILRTIESACIGTVRQIGLKAESLEDSIAASIARNRLTQARRLATIAVNEAASERTTNPLSRKSGTTGSPL